MAETPSLSPEKLETYRKFQALSETYTQGLYDYLRKECPTLEKAKAWIAHWADELGQYAPDIPEVTQPYLKAVQELLPESPKDDKIMFSISKMAIILSCVVENRGIPTEGMMRPDTKYGWELYYAGRGDDRQKAA